MLKLPIYARNGTFYFHTRYENHQIKRSLNTKEPHIAMIRALELLKMIDMTIDLKKIKKYEIDLQNGIFKSNGREDHQDMMEALTNIERIGLKVQHISPPTPKLGGDTLEATGASTGIRLPAVVEKFFNLKKQLKPATALQYKKTVNEFAGYTGNQIVSEYDNSDISRYMDHLASFNEPRTIDNKIGILNTVFGFAIKQGYYFKDNPAAIRKKIIDYYILSSCLNYPSTIQEENFMSFAKGQYFFVMKMCPCSTDQNLTCKMLAKKLFLWANHK